MYHNTLRDLYNEIMTLHVYQVCIAKYTSLHFCPLGAAGKPEPAGRAPSFPVYRRNVLARVCSTQKKYAGVCVAWDSCLVSYGGVNPASTMKALRYRMLNGAPAVLQGHVLTVRVAIVLSLNFSTPGFFKGGDIFCRSFRHGWRYVPLSPAAHSVY